MKKQIGLHIEVETTPITLAVAAAPGSAGQALAHSAASSNVMVTNTGADVQYKVGSGAWIDMDRQDGITLPVNLAETTLYFRRATIDGGPSTVDLIIDGVPTLMAGASTIGSAGEGGSVASVNDKTGNVELTAADVGALPVPYMTGAVHFSDAATSLVNPALVADDSSVFSFSYWFRTMTNQNGAMIFAVDAENAYATASGFGGGHVNVTTGNASPFAQFGANTSASPANGEFHHVLGCFSTNFASGEKIAKIYLDDLDVTSIASDAADAFLTAFSGKSFRIGDDGYASGAVMDMADFWFAPGQSLLDQTGNIPETTRRKFITANRKPVSLGNAGQLPTGTAPAIFLRCAPDAEATTFADNLGDGGAFSVVGTISVATASPSPALEVGFENPMLGAGDLIIGGADGVATRLANPGAGTFALQSINGVLTWVSV